MTPQNPYFLYEVIYDCNHNCGYCYNVWKHSDDYPRNTLVLTQIESLIDNLLQNTKPEAITLIGGEPLLHPNILDIIQLLSKKNIKTNLITNGALLDNQTINDLNDRGLRRLEISLNTADPQKHSKLSGHDDLDKIEMAILDTKRAKMQITVACIISKANLNDIPELIDLCADFGVNHMVFNRFIPGSNNDKRLIPSENELKEFLKVCSKKHSRYPQMSINITIPIEPCLVSHKEHPGLTFADCQCGKTKWIIDPAGNLRTCEQNPQILGNLLNDKFSDLSRLKTVESFRSNNRYQYCSTCEKYSNCGGGCRFI
ncbi:MAG: radical SAM protein [PVC group bacterium]|nr:radical SAM protein [PVC group bacterium]